MDNELIQRLIDIYSNAQQSLIDTIAKKEAKGNITSYQRELLKQIGQQLAELDKMAKDLSYEIVEKLYNDTLEEVNKVLETSTDISVSDFIQLHTKAIEVLAYNMYSNLNQANNYVGRRLNDEIRQAGINAVAQKVSQGQTVRECKNNLINMLIKNGVQSIKDKRGRSISLKAYAETVARSTTAEVTNTATINQLTNLNYDLVKMTEHNTTCPVCSSYQGRVYSISGNDSRFPELNSVPGFRNGYKNIHPNCRHRVAPYIESLANNLEEDIRNSNKSFDVDDRSKKAIDDYDKEQKARTQMRNDLNQYQRYRLALGKDAPKSFAAFRKMKYSKSGNYDELESQYRSLRQGGQ